MLDQWHRHIPFPPPLAPSPDSSSLSILLNSRAQATRVSDQVNPLNFAADLVSGVTNTLGFDLQSFELPAPWFIYSFMGVGILQGCITFIGCIAAETISGCCLCFYALLTIVLILLEAALVGFIAIDRHWEKDLPYDPTGELNSLRSFIEKNIDICKWVGLSVIIIQALSLLLAIILRAMVSTRKSDFDDEDDYEGGRGRTWEPLLNPQSSQISGSSKGDGRGNHSDIWSSRMRDKYGLNSGDNYTSPNQNTLLSAKSK